MFAKANLKEFPSSARHLGGASSASPRSPVGARLNSASWNSALRSFGLRLVSGAPGLLRLEFCVSLGHVVPVNHIKPGDNVIGPAILVFEVVGVLPNVDSEQRMSALANWVVLIRRSFYFQLLAVEHQPGPAAAKDFGGGLSKLALETRETAEAFVNGSRKLPLGLASAV